MLPPPQQLSGIDVNVRRFSNQLQKEFARQALRNKQTQNIRIAGVVSHATWFRNLCRDKTYTQYIVSCVNEQLEGSGWQITKTTPQKSQPGVSRSLSVVLKYRVERDEGLDREAFAA